MSACTCGLLEQRSRDPDVPISFDAQFQTYLLCLSAALRVPIAYCFSCGGSDHFKKASHDCACGLLERWASDSSLAFEFNSQLNEYHIIHIDPITRREGGAKIMVYFCPGCGGNAPRSKRDQLFEQVSDDELEEYSNLLAGAKTIEDLVRVLGQPSEISGPTKFPQTQKEIYGAKDIKASCSFLPPGKRILIIAQEMEDGKLDLFYFGRAKSEN